jgi:3-deoxy-D-manno-octulosonic-acid transferase
MIYNLAMYILELGVKLAALFSDKPAKMVKGYREVFDLLQRKIDRNA